MALRDQQSRRQACQGRTVQVGLERCTELDMVDPTEGSDPDRVRLNTGEDQRDLGGRQTGGLCGIDPVARRVGQDDQIT